MLEEMVRERYRIWRNPSKHALKQWRWVVYCGQEPVGQFKMENDAVLHIEARVKRDLEQLLEKIKPPPIPDQEMVDLSKLK